MTIWILALVILGAVAGIGYARGAIRGAVSLLAILLGMLLATPLSPLLKPIVRALGPKHPVIQLMEPVWAAALVFLVIVIVGKVVAGLVHGKVEHFFKYKREDEERFRFERMNSRVGACVGVVNGALYFLLLLVPIYVFGYATAQLANEETDPAGIRFVNRMNQDMRATKVHRIVEGLDPAPPQYFDSVDILALVRHNPLLMNRLWRYPGFLSLADRPEFQAIANDVQVNELLASKAPLATILKHPKVLAVTTNKAINGELRLLANDLKDMRNFLETGRSETYGDEKIIGQWEVDIDAAVAQEKKKKPNMSSIELSRIKKTMQTMFYGVTLTVTTDKRVILKSSGEASAAGTQPRELAQGTWSRAGDQYQMNLGAGTVSDITVDGDRLSLVRDGTLMVFNRQI